MVFTVEPGIYVAADAEDAPAEFRGIGVRIEDDIAITGGGCENLTQAIATDPEDVEALVTDR
jgi:Xaa-Pro aminopeptidase